MGNFVEVRIVKIGYIAFNRPLCLHELSQVTGTVKKGFRSKRTVYWANRNDSELERDAILIRDGNNTIEVAY